jgi:Holliday junction resolvase-like predicted endonuclease
LQDKSWLVRYGAADALGHIGSDEAITALAQALQDEHINVRRRAAEALGQIGNNQAVGALIQAMQDGDGNVQWSAVEALGRIGGESVVVALIQGLGDDVVRERVAKAIGQIDNQALGRGLLRGLMNNDDFVRRKAALVVGYYREDEQTLKNLVHLVSVDSITEVRDAANAGREKFRRKLGYFNHLFITTTTNPPSPPNLPPPLAAQERAELKTQIAAKYQEVLRGGDARQKGKALEELLAAVFASVPGFTVIERNYHTATEEIDLALRNASADPFWRGLGSLILVEAKNWQSQRVGKNEYAQFYRKLENRGGHCILGFLICTERFAETFHQERLRDSKFPLRVAPIDGEDLRRLVEAEDRAVLLREFVERAMLT